VSKEALFDEADIVSAHTLLSRRTRGLVNADALRLMKREAWLVNTSRRARKIRTSDPDS
jgi:phosphoglycerate dehydrogenase-like enzyme